MERGIVITDYIPVGHDNPITRRELKSKLNMSDRDIRHAIEVERLKGSPIINLGSGYYIADGNDLIDILEVQAYINTMRSRDTAIRAGIGALTNWLLETALKATEA